MEGLDFLVMRRVLSPVQAAVFVADAYPARPDALVLASTCASVGGGSKPEPDPTLTVILRIASIPTPTLNPSLTPNANSNPTSDLILASTQTLTPQCIERKMLQARKQLLCKSAQTEMCSAPACRAGRTETGCCSPSTRQPITVYPCWCTYVPLFTDDGLMLGVECLSKSVQRLEHLG